MTNINPQKPFSLLVKPVGSICNLECRYCFYLGTDEELEQGFSAGCGQGSDEGSGKRPTVMPDDVLEQMVKNFLSYGFPVSSFTWQGGEPTVAGLEFYRRVVELQQKYGRPGQQVANALQTNGFVIDDEWAEFLARYKFLVGLSLDGPQELHDHYRRDRKDKPTWERVISAADVMTKHGVEYNILCMITDQSQNRGAELYRYFTGLGQTFLQFIPCVEYDPVTGDPTPQNCTPQGYGKFMSDVFDEWHKADVGRISVRTFESVVARLAGVNQLTLCNLGTKCNHYLVVEKDGGVYPCDFFVHPRYHLGNLMDTSLAELMQSDRERSFSEIKSQYPESCIKCRHLDFCHGGCPKDRLTAGAGKFGRKTRLCEGLKIFYDHTRERMERLAGMVVQQQRAEAARRIQQSQSRAPQPQAPGSPVDMFAGAQRNDPCPCGSGKKFKHCCMQST